MFDMMEWNRTKDDDTEQDNTEAASSRFKIAGS